MSASGYKSIDSRVLSHYLDLEQPDGKVQLMYIWVGGLWGQLRCKTQIDKEPESPEDCKWVCIDGSKTEHTLGTNSDVYLKPCAIFPDPFRLGKNKLVLCETFTYDKQPYGNVNRRMCAEVMQKATEHEPWFGFEQRYTVVDSNNTPVRSIPTKKNESYCAVTTTTAIEWEIAESHRRACLYAGVRLTGSNAAALPSQWEFQVGPCDGVEAGDHLWMARYILHRVAQEFGLAVTFEPILKQPEFIGHNVQANFSTLSMRQPGGLKYIKEAVKKLAENHLRYSAGFVRKSDTTTATGQPNVQKNIVVPPFTSGIGDRHCSIRIPNRVAEEGSGYFEDRRPPADCDPYIVTRLLVQCTCLYQSSPERVGLPLEPSSNT